MTDRYKRFNEITFDAYCKTAIRNAVLKERMRQSTRSQREMPLSELPEGAFQELGAEDKAFDRAEAECQMFRVCGMDVPVRDYRLGKALSYLLPKNREIILLSYFMGLDDKEIAERLEMSSVIVRRRRNIAIQKLREQLENIP